MNSQTPQDPEHKMMVPAEGEAQEQDEGSEGSQQAGHTQRTTPMLPRLSEREIRRRLWRIYEMAFAAAGRTYPSQGEGKH